MKGRMKPMFRGSLQRKLLGVMLVTAFVTVLVALGAMIGHDLRESHRGWVEEIAAQAELLGRTTAPALSFDDAAVAQENLTLLSRQQRIRAAAIYDARGHRVAMLLPDAAEPPLPVLPGADGVQVDGGYLHAFRRVVDQNQILGTVYLRAEYALYERMGRYAGIGAVVIAIAMLAALGVSFWLQRLVTRPVLDIAATARHVMERQDYTRRAGKTSDDEVGVLADAFNDMLSEIERRTRALEAASQEQERLNAELERRVQERTAQLQQSNQELSVATRTAEQASRAKSEFLSSMSHELRTPLNAIIGFGQLLASDRFPADEQQRRTFVDHIVKSGRHLLALINEVLNLAQIEAGRLTLSLEPVALQDVLDDSRAMVAPLAAPRGIRVLFPERCTYAVTADRTRLKQVLLNLLSNAVKYNRDQGAVVVDCSLPAPGRVRVSVQDTGRGLTPRQIESLFQPFNRLGQEAGEQEGTGVGLVVTKHLVEMMDGRIGVQSTPGAGSVFWVDLPQADGATVSAPVPLASAADDEAKHPPEVPAAPPAPEDAKGAESATVLCVEDNPANLAFVRSALGHRPHLRLLTATDGRTGVELARAHRPQVILMDNNMPGLTGREALAVLMDDPATSGIPVIALTANAMPKAVDDGLAAGFFRYLTKPIDVDALIGAVDEALRESRDRGNG